MIHQFHLHNFKSIVDVHIDLSLLTVLIGRSGTGKTNIVEGIRFWRDFLKAGDWNAHRGNLPSIVSAATTQKTFGFAADLAKIRFTNLHGLFGFAEIGLFPSVLITGFVIVLLINAINLMDGIDGLAAGLITYAAALFGSWFYISGHIGHAVISFSLVGALIGFFYYNVYGKANKIFMGDTGSLFIGTVISAILIIFNELNIDQSRPFAVESVPAISFGILAYPLIDTIRVMAIRMLQHKSPFSADKNHLHHRLLTLGFSHRSATYTIIVLNILFVIAVFALHHLGVLRLMAYIFISGGILFMIPAYFIHKRKLIHKNDPVQQLLLPGSTDEIFRNRRHNLKKRKLRNTVDL